MINNKRVNVWRGDEEPPTIYDVWILNNSKLLLYNGEEWVIFLDDVATIQKIDELILKVDNLEKSIQDVGKYTVNGKEINTNPVLTGENLKTNVDGTYTSANDSVTSAIIKLDNLFKTIIIE